jgi:cytochrome c oxidase subunit 4
MSQGHVAPLKIYLAVFAALMVLTFVTVEVAFVDLGAFSPAIALSIACLKATLVILYFMHVRWSEKLVWILVGVGFLWLAILIAITMSDYLSRGWLPFPGK